MPTRGPLARFLLGSGVVAGGILALVGGVAVRGSGLVAVCVAGAVAAALAAGVAREAPSGSRARAIEAAWKAAAWTIGGLLVISGVVVLAGGVVATLLCGLAVVAGAGLWLLRSRRRAAGTGDGAPSTTTGSGVGTVSTSGSPSRGLLPVSVLPTPVLAREWLRTTAALAGRLDPTARQTIIRRREETLDELERRDPVGFARWLAAGPGADPARFVHGDVRGDQAAGTDAA